jgi:septum formation protein
LLSQIGVSFQVLDASIDESLQGCETPAHYVARLAAAKAEAGGRLWRAKGWAPRPVLAADTAVVIEGQILGKPVDCEDAIRMLALLSGRTHEVLTAVALVTGETLAACVSRSEVTFRVVSGEEALTYWQTGEPQDKAGAYAIQGRGAVFIAALQGSYSGVMGLPLYETAQFLDRAGVARWTHDSNEH